MSKRWNHKLCKEHVTVGSFKKVCILEGDDRDSIIRFAEEIEHIRLHRRGENQK